MTKICITYNVECRTYEDYGFIRYTLYDILYTAKPEVWL